MDRNTVFTKTAKGITQVNQKSASLSKDLMKVLKLIDGKSNFGQIMEKADLDKGSLEKALNTLNKDGFARVFQVRKEELDPFASEDDFDFTAPGKMPASTQRVVASAAGDISELVRQQDRADADQKARADADHKVRTQAQDAARAKAKHEAEGRAKLEAEARAKADAEQKAMEQARRAKDASERARAELEQKTREEESRKRAMIEQQARFTAEQKAKAEEEQRKLGELREKAEKEARALAEARARAEAEAAALARARTEAEAAAKKQAAIASTAEQEMKARLKEEIEARIRREMEDLLRNEVEEKTRAEMQAQILAEARLAARAELEERLRDERESLAKAESEARVKAEQDSRARADQEAQLRAQAEARAAAETQARIKAEEEARHLRRLAEAAALKAEAHAREQQDAAEAHARAQQEAAEAHAREQQKAAQRLEAERRAKIEAEARAKVEAEESERRQRELQESLDEERKAKQEAEMRARIEARARETIAEDTRAAVQAEIEGDMAKRAEIEGKAQARAYMEAKVKAEQDEDDRIRAEQARKAREIAQVLRTRVDADEDAPSAAPSKRRGRTRRGGLAKPLFYGIALMFILAIGALHVIPMRPFAAKIERAMSGWLHDDVSIASVTFRLLPTPHLRVENLAVGKLLDAKATHGDIYPDLSTLFGERLTINEVELNNVTLSGDAVRRITTWGTVEGKSAAGEIAAINLRNVRLDVKPAVDPFDASLLFNREGRLNSARLSGGAGRWTLAAKPSDKGLDLDFSARNWALPVGAAIPVSDVSMKGTLAGNEILVPEFEASALEGKVRGTLRVTWSPSGPVRLDSDLALAKVSAKDLIGSFTKDIAVTGKLDGNFTVTAEGANVATLLAAPRTAGKFKLTDGSISNVDLVAVMQSDTAGQRAGVTKFAELTGEYGSSEHRSSYRQVSMQGGVLRGNGAFEVGANSNITGRVLLEIRSQVAQDRGSFNLSGTISRPIIRRGGG
jgi:hypothetical protein